MRGISIADIIVIMADIVVIVGAGLWVARRRSMSVDGYYKVPQQPGMSTDLKSY